MKEGLPYRAGRGSSSEEDCLIVRRAQKVGVSLAVGSRVDGGAGGTCWIAMANAEMKSEH